MEYDMSSIVPLKGPDRVRKRPAVVFGSEGLDGSVAAVKSLLNIFVIEAALGCSSGIDIAIHEDNSISIRSYDRGFILDETVVDGKPGWYWDFCEIYCGPREMDGNYWLGFGSPHCNLYGTTEIKDSKYQPFVDDSFDLCAVQYVSKFMHVEVTRDGIKKILDFEQGFSTSDMHKEKSSGKSNTYIHFLLDTAVFEDTFIPANRIGSFLRDFAITIPGINFTLYDKRDNTMYTYHYPNGAQDYASETTTLATPLYIKELEATGKDRYNRHEYDANVKVLVSFVEKTPKIECFHNYRILEHGGHHLKEAKEQIVKYINWDFLWNSLSDFYDDSKMDVHERCNLRKILEFSFDELSQNIVLLIITNCTRGASSYENATKKAIVNKMIADMTHDLIGEDFKYYLKRNHSEVLNILKKIHEKRNEKTFE